MRKVRRDGSVRVAEASYYVKQALAGQHVVLQVDAATRTLAVTHGGQVLKRLPIKGLRGAPLAFADYLALMREEARADWRAWRRCPRTEAA